MTFAVEVFDRVPAGVGKVDALDRRAHLGRSEKGLALVIEQSGLGDESVDLETNMCLLHTMGHGAPPSLSPLLRCGEGSCD